MRLLQRNTVPFWYANFAGKEEIHRDGKPTGEYAVLYTEPVSARGTISAATGTVGTEIFGTLTDYAYILVCADPKLPIRETSVLWLEEPGGRPYTHVVRRISRSLNSVAVAVKEVCVDG